MFEALSATKWLSSVPTHLSRRITAVVASAVALASVGFDTSRHSVPLDEILAGGPPKDGIPAISAPRFVAADAATFLPSDDRVIGVDQEGVVKAYPLRILNWHEVVDDAIGTSPIAVTYCPLTGSAIVYDRRVNGQTLLFGVSGRLYQSNLLLYDQQSESLWSQLKAEAVTGAHTGARLQAIPSVTTTWADWRHVHPDTVVLSPETGYQRDYGRDPYAGYHASPELMFPVAHVDARLPAKQKVLGVQVGSVSKAYPLVQLAASRHAEDALGATRLRTTYDPQADRAEAVDVESGNPWPSVVVYWFAWSAFHPDTTIWQGSGDARSAAQPTVAQPRPGRRKSPRSGRHHFYALGSFLLSTDPRYAAQANAAPLL